MARPRHTQPTPAELEVLKIIWEHGPSTVRQVMEVLNRTRPRAYTSVMTLMGVMAEKGLLRQKRRGRAFVYDAKVTKVKARSRMLKDLLSRAFDGSASALVMNLLEQTEPSVEELEQIGKLLDKLKKEKGDN